MKTQSGAAPCSGGQQPTALPRMMGLHGGNLREIRVRLRCLEAEHLHSSWNLSAFQQPVFNTGAYSPQAALHQLPDPAVQARADRGALCQVGAVLMWVEGAAQTHLSRQRLCPSRAARGALTMPGDALIGKQPPSP